MQTHEKLIQKAMDGGWLTSLAFFYSAKVRFRNCCFYSHSLRKTSRKLGVSICTLRNHLLILDKHKLTRYHHGNLTFIGQKEMRKLFGFTKNDKYLCTIKLKDKSLKSIRHELRRKVLERKICQQQYWIDKKAENALLDNKNHSTTIAQVKFREKNRTALEKPINYTITFTDRFLAEQFNCSTSTITNFKKTISDIAIKQKPKKVRPMSLEVFNATYDILKVKYGNVFCWKGYLYQSLPTKYLNQVRHPLIYKHQSPSTK